MDTATNPKKCPRCNSEDGQMKNGSNRSGTQQYICRHCKKTYTPNPKRHAYCEDTRKLALKIYYAGASGRGIGKVLGMSKPNVYNWIKKTLQNVENSARTTIQTHDEACVTPNQQIYELDELYWFVRQKSNKETKENIYVITMDNRNSRQIVGFDVTYHNTAKSIQDIVDSAPYAENYAVDGYNAYLDVITPAPNTRNFLTVFLHNTYPRSGGRRSLSS